jgi:peptide/nickel transport system ATP-binding protein
VNDVLLAVRGLRMSIAVPGTPERRDVLLGVDLEIAAGEALALIGESGSGKSLTARSILRLLPEGARVEGDIQFRGTSVLGMSRRQLRSYRSGDVSMVFQDPHAHLDPTRTIGDFLIETLRTRRTMSRKDAHSRAVALLDDVRITNAGKRMSQYPHELSGGMLQRVMIASALAPEPALLLADEPTTALDVTVQAEVIRILTELRKERRLAMLFITHDVDLAEAACDRAAVMYAGRIVEKQMASLLSSSAGHPYTIGLMKSRPKLGHRAERLQPLPGRPLSAYESPAGCAFAERCAVVIDRCREDPPPPLRQLPSTVAACHRAEEASALLAQEADPDGPASQPSVSTRAVLIEVRNVSRVFRARGSFRRAPIVAVDDVTFTVEEGDSLAVVGESGSGKTSIARMLVGLERPTSGTITVGGQQRRGRRLGSLARAESARKMQIVFQDPYASLDPRQTVGAAIAEALRLSGSKGKSDLSRRTRDLMQLVGLPGDLADRYPRRLSGGQRQRVAIARALAPEPEVLVLDEPVASLDVSIQAQILNVLAQLRRELAVTYVFITHDLSVVRQVADTVMVMHHGKIAESGPVAEILENPQTEYTRTLLASVPSRLPAAGCIGSGDRRLI